MLSKEIFCNMLEWGIEQYKKEQKLSKALQEFSGDDSTTYIGSNIDFIIDILEEEMADKDQFISWWVWDTECGTKSVRACTVKYLNGEKHRIRTVEDLYDFLIVHYPLSKLQREIILRAQTEGVKFAISELEKYGRELGNISDEAISLKFIEKMKLNYLIETGIKTEVDSKEVNVDGCRVKIPDVTLFGKSE